MAPVGVKGLNERRQAACIEGQFSQWLTLAGGMPQGPLIGPLTFILLIDDLRRLPHSQICV